MFDTTGVVGLLGDEPLNAASESALVDRLRALEDLKSAVCAEQMRVAVALEDSRVTAERSVGVPSAQWGQGVGPEVGLACRLSPYKGVQFLSIARALVRELPYTLQALSSGVLSQWRASIIVRESSHLNAEARRIIDTELCSDTRVIESCGDKKLAALVKRVAYRVEPELSVARAAYAERERRVSVRPAPESMAYVTALVPMAQGVSLYAALVQRATEVLARPGGEERTKAQVMADVLVQRVLGQDAISAVVDPVPIALTVVMTDDSVLGGEEEPAEVVGYGPIPAGVARKLLFSAEKSASLWVRRLFAPKGSVVQLESRSRCFPKGLADYLNIRDGGVCRTPWCDAPIRHHDHVVDFSYGGATTADNGQGLCEKCNYTKSLVGWRAKPVADSVRHCVGITSPTGHHYRSTAPPLPGCYRLKT